MCFYNTHWRPCVIKVLVVSAQKAVLAEGEALWAPAVQVSMGCCPVLRVVRVRTITFISLPIVHSRAKCLRR